MRYPKNLVDEIIQFSDNISKLFINEPLDGDEVDSIIEQAKLTLNLQQGNITLEEYRDGFNKSQFSSFWGIQEENTVTSYGALATVGIGGKARE